MTPQETIVRSWVESTYGMDWNNLSVEERDEMTRRYNEAHPVLQVVPTFHERLLKLLSGALEGSFLRTGSNEHAIRTAMKMIRVQQLIEKYAEAGFIKVVESGRDCDGVEYDGIVRVIDATLDAYMELADEISESADGPFQLCIVPMSDEPEYSTRDLVMEAHENGHRHSIVSRFP